MNDQLKPCPFCGGEAKRMTLQDEDNFGGDVIVCTKCDACSRVVFGEKEGLEDAWNRRHSIPAAPTPEERLCADINCERQYIAGMKAGWNFAQSGDEAGYQRAVAGRVRDIQEAKAGQEGAAPEPEDGYMTDLIERLNDAQQEINLAANTTMSQALCDAASLLDEVESAMIRYASPPSSDVEALRKDAERLDWMIKEIAVVHDLVGQSGPRYCIYWPDLKEEQISTHETPRAAIDAAMESLQ